MVRRPFAGPTRGAAATLGGFSPLSTHRGLGFSHPRCLYMSHIDFCGITPPLTLTNLTDGDFATSQYIKVLEANHY
jgi:hypothetical protein